MIIAVLTLMVRYALACFEEIDLLMNTLTLKDSHSPSAGRVNLVLLPQGLFQSHYSNHNPDLVQSSDRAF
jgi:hypothetical protein